MVSILLHQKADTKHARNCGATPLLIAAQKGHCEVVSLLLRRNACVNVVDNNGVTPLINTAQKGHLDMVTLLLAQTVDVNHADSEGDTALTVATGNQRYKVAKLLLIEGKANASHKTNDGSNALHIAASLGNRKLVRLLSPHLELSASELDDLDNMVPDDVKAKLQLRRCSFCAKFQRVGQKKLQKCSRCLSARYCDSDCQRGHWRAGHKQECRREE